MPNYLEMCEAKKEDAKCYKVEKDNRKKLQKIVAIDPCDGNVWSTWTYGLIVDHISASYSNCLTTRYIVELLQVSINAHIKFSL